MSRYCLHHCYLRLFTEHLQANVSQNNHFGVAGFALTGLVDGDDAVFKLLALRLFN